MAEVPRLGDRIQRTGFPGARVDSSAPIESFGGGPSLDRSFESTRRAIKTTQDILKEEKKKANDVAAQEYRANLLREKNTLLWDHANGAFNRKGRDALGVPDEYGSRLKKYADGLDAGLADDEQRAIARRIRLEIETEFSGQLQKHVFSEVASFDERSTRFAIDNEIEDGVQNWSEPGKLDRALKNIHAMTNAYAARTGKSPSEVEKIVKDSWSKLARGTIEAQASQEQDLLAEATFHRYKDFLSSSDRAWAEKFVGESRRDNDSRRKAHELWDKAGGDYNNALKLAEQQADSKSYPLVKKWLKEFSESQEGTQKQEYEKLYQDASNHVWQMKERPPLNVWSRLKPEHQRALEGVLRSLRKGENIVDDLETYSQLMQEAAHPATQEKFRKTFDPKKYVDKLSPTTLKKVIDLHASLFKDKGEKDPHGLLTGYQVVENAMEEAGIKKDKDKATFRMRVHERALERAKQKNSGAKKATLEDVQAIVDDELKEITIRGSFLGIIPTTSKKRSFKTKLEDFSKEDIAKARAAALILSHGEEPPKELILDILRKELRRREGEDE